MLVQNYNKQQKYFKHFSQNTKMIAPPSLQISSIHLTFIQQNWALTREC